MKKQKNSFVKPPPGLFFFLLILVLLIPSTSFAEVSLELSSSMTLEHTKGEIELNGDWINSGTFTPGTYSIINFNGSTPQTISKFSGGDVEEQFHHIIIDNELLDFTDTRVFISGDWQNNTIYNGSADQLNVYFNGVGYQYIYSDLANITFYRIAIDKSAGQLWVNTDIDVTDRIKFITGNLYTGEDYQGEPYIVTLNNSAHLLDERDGNYLIGWLNVSRSLGTNQSSDFGSTGLNLGSTPEDWGTVTITRVSGDTLLNVGGSYHFNRRWKIEPENTPTMGRDITFSWQTDDEDTLNLEWVQTWKSIDSPAYAVPNAWETVGIPQNISSTNPHQISVYDSIFHIDEDPNLFRWWTVNDDNVNMDFPTDFVVRAEDISFTEKTDESPHKVSISSVIRAFYITEAVDVIVKFYARDLTLGESGKTLIDSKNITFPGSNPFENQEVTTHWSPPNYHEYQITVEITPDISDDTANNSANKNLNTQDLSPPDITVDASQLIMSIIGNEPIYDINLKVPIQASKPLGANMENVKIRFEMNDLGDASRAYQLIGETTVNFTNGQETETQYADVDWLPITTRSDIGSYYMPDRHYEHNYDVKVDVDTDALYDESDETNIDTITDQLMDFVPPDFRILKSETEFSESDDDTNPVNIKTKIYADSLVTYLNDLEISFYYQDLDDGGDQTLIQSNYLSYEGTGDQFTAIDWLPLYYHDYDVTVTVNSDNRYTESESSNSTATKKPKLAQDFKPDIYLEGNDYIFTTTGSKPYDAMIHVPFHVTKYVKNMPDVAVTVKAKNRENQNITTLYDQNISFSQGNKYETHTVYNIFWDLPESDVPDYKITAKVDATKLYNENPNEANNVASKEFGGVKIKKIKPEWDRLPNDPNKVGKFIPRVSLENEFTAKIDDPNGMGIDHVEFTLADESITDSNGENGWKATFDMGEIQNNPKMTVIAYDSWGIATQKKVLEIDTADELLWLKYVLNLLNQFEFTQCEKEGNREGDEEDEPECEEVNLSPVMVDITDDGYLQLVVALGAESVLGNLTNKKGSTTEDAKGIEDQDSGGSGEVTFTLEFGLNPGTGARGEVEIGYSDKACGKNVELPFDVTINSGLELDPDWELESAWAGLNVDVLVFEMPETKLFSHNFGYVIQVFVKLSMDIHAEVDLLCYMGPDARFKVDRYNSGRIEKASHVKLGPTVNGVLKLGVGDATGCFEVGCAAKPSLSMLFYVNWFHENQQAGTEKGKIEVEPGMEVLFSVDGSLYVSVLWGAYEWEFLQTNLMDVTCDIPFKHPNNACCGCAFLQGLVTFNDDCYFGEYGRGRMPILNVPIVLPSPSMDSDNLGNVFTVFTRELVDPNYPEIADAEIFYFTRDPAGNISEPFQITDNEAFETNPKFTFLNDNLGMLIWTQNAISKEEFVGRARSGDIIGLPEATSKQDIYYSLWDGENWSAGAPVMADSLDSPKSDGMTTIEALGDSSAIACWVRATGDSTHHKSGWRIYSAVYDSASWSTPVELPGQDGAGNFGVQVAGKSDGSEAMAIWSKVFDYVDPGAPYNIYSSRWQKSTDNWSEPVSLENSAAQNKYADVTYLDDGSAAACWTREFSAENFRQIDVFDSFAVDTFWIDPHNYYLDTISVYTQETVIDTILINHLMAAHWDSVGGWSAPEVALIDSQFIETPTISVNDQGIAVITFNKSSRENTAGDLFAIVKNYDIGGSWSVPRQLTDDPYTNMSIAADIDANNNSVMVSQTWDFADTAAAIARMRGERNIDPYGGLSMRSYGMDRSGEFYDGININYASIAPDFKVKDEWVTISDCDTTTILSDTLSAGDTLWVRVPVKNVGYAASDTTTLVSIYNAHPDSSALLLKSIPVPALAVDSTFVAEFNLLADSDNTNLFVVVNPDTVIAEQSRLNNMAHISYDLIPDFTVTNVWLSDDAPSEGDVIQIGAEVTNLTGSNSQNVSVVCREDVSDTAWKWLEVDEVQIVESLSVGQMDTVYFDYTVTGGSHNFRVTINPDSTIAESNYKNNCPGNTGGVILFAYSDIELVESSIQSSAGDTSFTNIEAKIRNIGQFTAHSIWIELFDGHPFADDTQKIDSLLVPMLGAGQNEDVELRFSGTKGQHDLQIWINREQTFPESDYGNNSAEFTVYQHENADLAVDPGEIDISNALPSPADTVEVSVVIRNLGEISATDVPIWLYRVDNDNLIPKASALLDQIDPTTGRESRSRSGKSDSRRSISRKGGSLFYSRLNEGSPGIEGEKKSESRLLRSPSDPQILTFEFVIEDSLSGMTEYEVVINPDKGIAETSVENNQVEFFLNIGGTGGGGGKLIGCSHDSLDYGRIQVGNSDTMAITLTNDGDEMITISAMQFDDGGMVELNSDVSSFILSPGIGSEIEIVFMPQDNANDVVDTLTIVNSSTNSPELKIGLFGFSISAPIVDIPDTTLSENVPMLLYESLNDYVVDNDNDAVTWSIAGFDTVLIDSVALTAARELDRQGASVPEHVEGASIPERVEGRPPEGLSESRTQNTSKSRKISQSRMIMTRSGEAVYIYPNQEKSGTAWITFKAIDADGLSDLDRVTVTIPEFNRAPVTRDTSLIINEDESVTIPLDSLATDPDGDELEWEILAENPTETNIELDDENHEVTFTPDDNIFGEFILYLNVTDTKAEPDTITINLSVNSVNDIPIWSGLSDIEFDEDSTFTLDLKSYVEDVETPDSLMLWDVSISEISSGRGEKHESESTTNTQKESDSRQERSAISRVEEPLEVTISDNGIATFTPAANWNGTKQITFKAMDEAGDVGEEMIQTTVNSVNDAPVFISTPQDTIVYADSMYQYLIVTEDVDISDILTLDAVSIPPWLNLTDNADGTGELTGTPTDADSGSYIIKLSVADTANATDTQIYNLHVHTCRLYDVNCDGVIDIRDVQKISAMFGIEMDDPKYDFDGSGVIDDGDLQLIILEWKR